uniref:C2 domain-containing protein n=1 Tax=Meloidogyne javanica TaxID=6303 RepID=A0A915LIA8_MELJA
MTLTPINEEQKELFNEHSIRGIVSKRKGKQEIQKDEEQTTSENENIIKNNNYCSFIEDFNGNIESQLYKKYNFLSSFHSFEDVGFLIFKTEGLAALDVNGKSDPFCVLELCNFRLQTHTEYKTLCPKWNYVHQIIELTVYDEDPNKRVEFLGKIAIPLLNIFNGEKRWYMLKNKKLDGPAKGRILVEGTLYFNYVYGIDEQQQIIISKSLRERLQAIQETLTLLQQQGDFLVGLIDRIKG